MPDTDRTPWPHSRNICSTATGPLPRSGCQPNRRATGNYRARPVARRNGDRLLRFPRLAGSDFRRRPRRTLRGAQRRQSGAGFPAGRRRPWRVGGAGIRGTGAAHQAHRGARPCAMRRIGPSSTISIRCRRAISSAAGWRCSSSRAKRSASASRRPGDFTTRIEKAAVFRLLENLMTFPFVRSRVERGEMELHGAYSASPRARCSCSTRRAKEFGVRDAA